MLVAGGLINGDQLKRALEEQKKRVGKLGEILTGLGFISEHDIATFLGRQLHIPFIEIEKQLIDTNSVQILPGDMARRLIALPLYKDKDALVVAMADPLNIFGVDDIRKATGMEIRQVVATRSDILKAIDRYFGMSQSIEAAAIDFAGEQGAGREAVEITGPAAEDAPVVKMVSMLIAQAISDRASDIHIDSEGNHVKIRYRIDGVLKDPVEYQIMGVNQMQVNPKAGVTFASGLRSILRQDPDIIMVGEIRDRETAEIAVQAALTGHLVFATLHTNDAGSAATRLIDMGIEPFLIASSVIGILAQRLTRKICDCCKKPYPATQELLKSLGMAGNGGTFYRGEGCPACKNTGYLGRIGLYELIDMNEAIRTLIIAKASNNAIKTAAAQAGFKTLRQEGLLKVAAGVTSIEEVLRVTQEAEEVEEV